MCRVVGAGTSFQMVMHEKLQQTFLQRSFVGCCVHTGDCDGQNAPASSPVPVLIQCCRWSLIVAGWYLMLWHTQSNCNLAWNKQWSGIVGLCPFPTSSVQPFGWDWVGGLVGGLWVLDQGTMKCTTLQLWHPSTLGFTDATVCFTLLKILCSSTKSTFVLLLRAWCISHVFGCALSGYQLSSHWVSVCLLWVYIVIEHNVNSKLFQISTSWAQKILNTR